MLRTRIINSAVIVIFLVLLLYLFNFQVISGAKFRDLGNNHCIRLHPAHGSRGRILDRKSKVIVDNQLCYDAMIMSQPKEGIEKAFTRLSGILNKDTEELKRTFSKSFIGSFAPTMVAENIGIKQAAALEELKSEIDGLIIQPRPQRSYPYGMLACHVVGYLGEIDRWRLTRLADYGYKTKDVIGFGGVEERYDYYLRQEEGGFSVAVDHRGRFVRVLGFRPPKSGKDIQLTLDLDIQKIVEEEMGVKLGAVIIMDPGTGEIIAITSRPGFNPSIFIRKSAFAIRSIFNNPASPLVNRAISSAYPPGSIFKLVVAAAGLETGKIKLTQRFYCSGSTYIGRQEFGCWDTHSSQNLFEAITHSCNVFFYRAGLIMGAQTIYEYALKFGLGRPGGIDLPYEKKGLLPNPLWAKLYRFRNWLEGDTANLSIGQGDLLVTPIQIARMTAIFANNGFLVTPYIIKALDGRPVISRNREPVFAGLKESAIDSVKKGMRNVVADPSGTAGILGQLDVSVAGKTGTAQAPPRAAHGWFTGFFPFKEPKFVICVFLERGGSGHAAVILARQIIQRMSKEGLIK